MDDDSRLGENVYPVKNNSRTALGILMLALATAVVVSKNSSPGPQEDGTTLTHVDVGAIIENRRLAQSQYPVLPGQVERLPTDIQQNPPSQPTEEFVEAEVNSDVLQMDSPVNPSFTDSNPTIDASDIVQLAQGGDDIPQLIRSTATSLPPRNAFEIPTQVPPSPPRRFDATPTAAVHMENQATVMSAEDRIEMLKKELNITIKTAGEHYSPEERENLEQFGVDLQPSPHDKILMDLVASTILSMHKDVQSELKTGPYTIVIERILPGKHRPVSGVEFSSLFYVSEDGVYVLQVNDSNDAFSQDGNEDKLPSGLDSITEVKVVVYDGMLNYYFNTDEGRKLLADYLRANDDFYIDPENMARYLSLFEALRFSETETYISLESIAARLIALFKIAGEDHFVQTQSAGLETLSLPVY